MTSSLDSHLLSKTKKKGEARCPRPSELLSVKLIELRLAKGSDAILKRLNAREPQRGSCSGNTSKLFSKRRDSLVLAVCLPGNSGVRDRVAGQGKSHVERRRWRCVVDDVSADSQPIWRQVRVTDPRLQIPGEDRPRRHDWSGSRKKQKVSSGDQDLWAEEIMAGRQNDRSSKVMSISTFSPTAGPSPCVVGLAGF